MSPLLLLFVAKDARLSWEFDGTSTKAAGKYELVGRSLRGEVAWFAAPKGRYDAQALYKSDTERTKEADATTAFSHLESPTTLAAMPALQSDQTYLWDGAAVASRCVYCAKGNRAWVVRLWWPRGSSAGKAAAITTLKSFKRLP